MRIHPSAVLVGTLLMMAPPGVRAQDGAVTGDPVKGAALLAEARQALGGEEKLRAIKTLQAKGSFKRTAGNNQLEGDVELLIELPGKMKRTEDMSLPGGGPAVVVTQTLNGEQVWDENTGGRGGFGFGGPGGGRGFGGGGRGFGGGRGGQQGGGDNANAAGTAGGRRGNIDPEQLRQAQVRQRQAELSRLGLAWLLSTDGSIEWIGTAQSPDGTADVLEVRETDGTVSTRLFLDAASHMPLMITWQGNVPNFRRGGPAGGRGDGGAAPGDGGALPGGGDQAQAPRRGGPPAPVTLQMTMADYKAVNGVKLPQTITRGTAGQTTEEWSVSSYKVNPAFKAGTFEQKR